MPRLQARSRRRTSLPIRRVWRAGKTSAGTSLPANPIDHSESVPALPFELSTAEREAIAMDIRFTKVADLRNEVVRLAGIPTRKQLGLGDNRHQIVYEQAVALSYLLTPLQQRPWLQPRTYEVAPLLDYVAARTGCLDERAGDRTKVNRAFAVELDHLLRALPEDWPPWLITRPLVAGPVLPEGHSRNDWRAQL